MVEVLKQHARVHLPDGTEVQARLGETMPAGGYGVLMIRPERIALTSPGGSARWRRRWRRCCSRATISACAWRWPTGPR